jgi:hypothetical protein
MPRPFKFKLNPTNADALDLLATLPEGRIARLGELLAAERALTGTLAAAFNAHIDYVNATRQAWGGAPCARRDAEILALWDAGKTTGQITQDLGLDLELVKKIVTRKGARRGRRKRT